MSTTPLASTTAKPPVGKKMKNVSPPPPSERDRDSLIHAIDAAGLQEFTEYIRSPWKMLWPNFVAGVARGIGALFGVALVLTLLGWFFAVTIDLPLIGKRLEPYVQKVQNELNTYIDQTNYTDEFDDLLKALETIEKNTARKN